MAKTVEQRLQKFTAKYQPTRLQALAEAMKPDMLEKVEAMATWAVDYEERTRAVLRGETAIVTTWGFYLAFSRQIAALVNKGIEGNLLIEEVATRLASWKARGLSEPILDKIRNDVWSIPAPAGP